MIVHPVCQLEVRRLQAYLQIMYLYAHYAET